MRQLIARLQGRDRKQPVPGSGARPVRADIPNEAVNFALQCIFIALPKNGTSSVRSQLQQQGVPLIANSHLDILQVRELLYVYLLQKALGKNRTFPTQAIPEDADIRTQARNVFDSFFKFAAVRNPWARAVSLYLRRESIQMRNRMSFDEFCDNHLYASDTCIHPTLHRNQLDWLCDENGRCVMDFVYKLEEFEKARQEIAERTGGRVRLEGRKEKVNPYGLSQDYRTIHTVKTKQIVAKRFSKDIDVFKYTF